MHKLIAPGGCLALLAALMPGSIRPAQADNLAQTLPGQLPQLSFTETGHTLAR